MSDQIDAKAKTAEPKFPNFYDLRSHPICEVSIVADHHGILWRVDPQNGQVRKVEFITPPAPPERK